VPGTRSVFAERAAGGYFLDFTLRREQLARYGLSIKEAEMVLTSAVGGETVTTTVEGRERYTVSVRYARELRDNLPKLRRVLVTTSSGAHIPLADIADIELTLGPSMIRDENGMLAGYVFIDMAGRDIGGYVEDAKRAVAAGLRVPEGYALLWSGQYENMLRVRERLKVVVPITLLLIFMLLYMNTKSAVKASIVMLAVPFSVIGAVWYLYLLGYNVSIAVWVGMIALAGLDAETGVFMLLFLDMSYEEWQKSGRLKTPDDLNEAIVHGAVKRVRPKMMTVCAPSSHHVVHRLWIRYDEARRGPDGRWTLYQLSARAPGVPPNLRPLEAPQPSRIGSNPLMITTHLLHELTRFHRLRN